MQADAYTKKIINLLAQQEGLVSELYRGYASQFPNAKFWEEMAKEENVHEQWVLSLYKSPENVYFDKTRFNEGALTTMVNYLKELIQESKNHHLIKALSLALDIERSLIEKNYFKVYESDSPQLKHVLSNLSSEQDEHSAKVEEELRKAKAGEIH